MGDPFVTTEYHLRDTGLHVAFEKSPYVGNRMTFIPGPSRHLYPPQTRCIESQTSNVTNRPEIRHRLPGDTTRWLGEDLTEAIIPLGFTNVSSAITGPFGRIHPVIFLYLDFFELAVLVFATKASLILLEVLLFAKNASLMSLEATQMA